MKSSTIAALAVVFTASSSVYAADEKFYMGAELGSVSVDNQAQEVANAFVDELGGAVLVTQTVRNSATRIFAGLTINEHIDAEVGYVNTQDFKSTITGVAGSGFAYSAVAKTNVSGLDYSLLLRPSKASGFNNAFLRVGMHDYDTKTSGSLSAGGMTIPIPTETESGTGSMLGVGFDWDVQKNISLRVSVTQMSKLSGDSDSDATFTAVGLRAKF